MNTFITLVLVALAVVNIVVIFFLLKKSKSQPEDSNQSSFNFIQAQINDLSRTVDGKMGKIADTLSDKLSQSSREMSEAVRLQFGESQKLIKDITGELIQFKETNKQVISFADQLQSLQDILKNPKQRGILGEYYLETLLKNVMPPGSYEMQYKFKNGEIVDAVVFVKDKIIPIDSKFSLENYNRLVGEKDPERRSELERIFRNDLKTRIDETSKYVRADENTMDFAFMFIPHEAIYYDLLVAEVGGVKINTRDLIEYAFKDRKVIIVSPTSFLAFLQTVLQGLRSLQIEEKTKEIIKRVEEIGKHLKSFDEFHKKVGASLGLTVSHYNNSSKEFKKIDKDVLRITGQNNEVESVLLDKPEESS